MSEKELLKQLCNELKAAALNYKLEALDATAQDSILMLKLLTNRCEKFVCEIEIMMDNQSKAIDCHNEDSPDETQAMAEEKLKAFEQIFERLEKSESRLECLYRKILQNCVLEEDLRTLLEHQAGAISKWHDFIITEEINFILAGEVRIPPEFQQKFYYGAIR